MCSWVRMWVCVFIYTYACKCVWPPNGDHRPINLKGESCVFSRALVCVCVFIWTCVFRCVSVFLSMCLYFFVCECGQVCVSVCDRQIATIGRLKGESWILPQSTLPPQWDFVAMFSALQKPQDAPCTSQRPYCKSGSALNAPFCTTFADYLERILVCSAVRTPSAHCSYSFDFKS